MNIETIRLTLREITLGDAEFILRLVNDPSFMSNIGDKGLRNTDDAKKFIRSGPWKCQEKPGYGQFVVELRESGEPTGVCGLLHRETLDVTDVGFAFLPQYRGHGFAFEAADAVMKYGYSTLGVDRIVALTSEDNVASIKVLKKLGMEFERTVKMSIDDPGTVLYS